jgi:hypothetical protein
MKEGFRNLKKTLLPDNKGHVGDDVWQRQAKNLGF